MRNFFILTLSVVFLFIFAPFLYAQTENITIATYYPSPHGVYTNLRLFPTTVVSVCNAASEGMMYYDNNVGTNQVRLCQETSPGVYGWQNIGAGFWTQVGNNLYPNDANWNVGIGMNNPAWKLDVSGNTRLNGWVRMGDGSGTNNIQFETQTGFNRIAFNELRFWDWDSPGDMVTFNNGIVSVGRFVIQKRAGNPPTPQEGEIWLIQ